MLVIIRLYKSIRDLATGDPSLLSQLLLQGKQVGLYAELEAQAIGGRALIAPASRQWQQSSSNE